MTARSALLLASLSGVLAVVFGAFGVHALRGRLSPEALWLWHTAVEYQFYHALALLAAGLWLKFAPAPGLTSACWAFAAGIVLFCCSLYLLALGAPRAIGAITPFGGLSWIAGWLLLARAAWRASV
ncbi:MAG: DUF423 domain-containing protein [Gammaproteobacteria bacterium]|nr:DUF423 domain-containing protein [Gammaproteobacteria bacterium]